MYNEINIDTPSAGKNRTYSIAEDDSAKLSLDSNDINGVAFGDKGELVIDLKNGGQVTIINFQSFTQAGYFIYLNDGTLLNFAALTTPPSEEVLLTSADNPDNICEIDLSQLITIDEEGELVVRLADGKEIPIDGTFSSIADEMTIEDSATVDSKELLTKASDVAKIAPAAGDKELEQIAKELAALDPQAGDGAARGNSGYGYGSTFEITDFNAPDDIGPLGPTQLLYNAPNFSPERFLLDDSPIIFAGSEVVDETNFENGVLTVDGQLRIDFGADGAGRISGTNNFNSSAPSFGNIILTSHGNPVIVSFDNTTNSYIGTTINDYHTIATVFTLEINPKNGRYTYAQYEPLDHPDNRNPDDPLFLDFGVIIRDSDGDSARNKIRITVLDDGPQIDNVTHVIDETDLNGKHEISVHGFVPHDFGEDGKGEITANGLFHHVSQIGGHPSPLTSGGKPVVVTSTQSGYVGKVGHEIIFTLDINPHTGKYTYTQFDGIDHPNAHDPNDVIWLKFYVDITDFDGDKDTGVIVIDVYDDGPKSTHVTRAFDETDLFGKHSHSVTGTLANNFGADDEGGTVIPNGHFTFLTQANGDHINITSGGHIVDITKTNDGYVGKIGDKIIFNLNIDSNTGNFTYTQYDTLDHPDAHNPNDVIWLKFGVTVIDGDGDKANSFIQIDVRDDGPNAVNDSRTLTQNQNRITGNILSNDDFGADGAGMLLTSGTFRGNFGTLQLNSNGSYTYTRNGDNGGTDRFNYTIKDADGDKDTAQLTITVQEIPPPNQGDGAGDGDGGDGCPLVIDLNGDGITLTNKNEGVFFDIDEDGYADRTAWVGADDGILVFDKNNDGIINDHSEMFGNDQIGGFEMLGYYDDNQDGIIDANDVIWSSLKIWQDRNQDGYSQSNEFITFDDLQIQSIDLNVTNINETISGNAVTAVGAFNTATGGSFNAYDAWFKYDSTAALGDDQTISVKDIFESAQTMENIHGNGIFKVAEFSEGNILTHNGENINITYDQNTSIYFGATSEKIIFNIKIEEDGNYHFNLFESIDQGLHGDSLQNITLQFGIVGENNLGDETQEFVSINIKGMSNQFAHATNDMIDLNQFLEGVDPISHSLNNFVQETTDLNTEINGEDNPINIFNVNASMAGFENQQTDII